MSFNLTAGATGASGPAGMGGISTQSAPGNPSGTSDTTGTMMGLAGAITPANSGVVLFMVHCTVANDTSGKTTLASLRTGTGAAPANAAALTGTAWHSETTDSGGARVKKSMSLVARVALSAGTAYWFDLGLASPLGGTSSIADVSMTAVEL